MKKNADIWTLDGRIGTLTPSHHGLLELKGDHEERQSIPRTEDVNEYIFLSDAIHLLHARMNEILAGE